MSSGPFRQMFNYNRIWRWAMLLTALVTLLPLILITTLDYQVTQESMESEFHLLRTRRRLQRPADHLLFPQRAGTSSTFSSATTATNN